MITCPACGVENASDATVCAGCGVALPVLLPTRRDEEAPGGQESGTRRDGGGGRRTNLPSGLAERFAIVERLPGGNEADVLVVRDAATHAERVLKLYRSHIELDDRVVGLLREASTAGEGGRHLVVLYENGRAEYDDGESCWYEVLEYCREGSLRDLMSAVRPPTDVQ